MPFSTCSHVSGRETKFLWSVLRDIADASMQAEKADNETEKNDAKVEKNEKAETEKNNAEGEKKGEDKAETNGATKEATECVANLKIEENETGRLTPSSPSAAQSGSFLQSFKAFSKFGDPKSDGKLITLSQSDKWMKQAKVIDGRKITTTDTGIYFKKHKYESFFLYLTRSIWYFKN